MGITASTRRGVIERSTGTDLVRGSGGGSPANTAGAIAKELTFVGRHTAVNLVEIRAELTRYPSLYVKPSAAGSAAAAVEEVPATDAALTSNGTGRVGRQSGVDPMTPARVLAAVGQGATTEEAPSAEPPDRAEAEDIVDVPSEEEQDVIGTGGASRLNLVYTMTLAAADQQQQRHPVPLKRRTGTAAPAAAAAVGRTWRIRRTLGDFLALHKALRPLLGWGLPDFPREHRWQQLLTAGSARSVDPGAMTRRLRQYLLALLEVPHVVDLVPLREFLEVSRASFDPLLGWKGKEGTLLSAYDALFVRGVACAGRWRPYWMALRDSYLVAYADSRAAEPSQAILLDEACDVYSGAVMPVADCGTAACMGGARADVRSITLITGQGRVLLAARSKREADDWVTAIRERIRHCVHTQRQPLGSFAPPRRNMLTRWFVDARNFYEAAIEALSTAQHEVLVTGWWLTPDLAIARETADVAVAEGATGKVTATEGAGSTHLPIGQRAKDWVESRLGVHEEEAAGGDGGVPGGSLGGDHRTVGLVTRTHEHPRVYPPSVQADGDGAGPQPSSAGAAEFEPLAQGTATAAPPQSVAASKTAASAGLTEDGVPAELAMRIRMTLKSIIKDRAEAGCRVFVNMYQEPPMSMALDSMYQKRVLEGLHPNVHVIRHGEWLWSHHEKIVVVDRKVAFFGGLDISWGRWDTGAHVIIDPDRHVFPQSVEYYQPAVADWANVEEVWAERVDRNKYAKMPWHDVHMCVRGEAVHDVVHHFVQRWNFTRAAKGKTALPVLLPHGPWPGKASTPTEAPPVPQGAVDEGTQTAAEDFTEAAARAAATTQPSSGSTQQDASHRASQGPVESGIHGSIHRWLEKIRQRKASGGPPPQPTKPPAYPTADSQWYCSTDWTQQWCKSNVQILRSSGEWSLGTSTENSIYNAYIHAILNSEHFLYIENQYVISALGWTPESRDELAMAEAQTAQHMSDDNTGALMAWLLGDKKVRQAQCKDGERPGGLQQESLEEHASRAAEEHARGDARAAACATKAAALPDQPHQAGAASASAGASDGTPPSRWEHAQGGAKGGRLGTAAGLLAGSNPNPAGKVCPPDRAVAQGVTRSGLAPVAEPKHFRPSTVPPRHSALPGLLGKGLSDSHRQPATLSTLAMGTHASSRAGSRGRTAINDRRAAFPKSAAAAEGRGGADSGAGADELLTPSERRRAAAVIALWKRKPTSHAGSAGVALAPANDRSLRMHRLIGPTAAAGPASSVEAAETAPFGELALPEATAMMVQGAITDRPKELNQAKAGPASKGGAPVLAEKDADDTPPASEGVLSWAPDRNPWAEALYIRLVRAIANKEAFKAIIVLPVHPDGPLRANRAIQLVLHWEARTISRGGWSLLDRLRRRFPDVDLTQYVEFFCLRNYAWLHGRAMTEQVYVHSKLLIQDDRLVIMGSANLNDRSLYGDRDSEIAAIVTGGDKVLTRLGGMPWRSTVFAHTLRRNLMEEHLGLAHTCPFFTLKGGAGSTTSREEVLHGGATGTGVEGGARAAGGGGIVGSTVAGRGGEGGAEEEPVELGRALTRIDNAHVPHVPLRLVAPQEKHRRAAAAAAAPFAAPTARDGGGLPLQRAVPAGLGEGTTPEGVPGPGADSGKPTVATSASPGLGAGAGDTAFFRPDARAPLLTREGTEPVGYSGGGAPSAAGESAPLSVAADVSEGGLSVYQAEPGAGGFAPTTTTQPPESEALSRSPLSGGPHAGSHWHAHSLHHHAHTGSSGSSALGARDRVLSLAGLHMLPSSTGPMLVATNEPTQSGALISQSQALAEQLALYGPLGPAPASASQQLPQQAPVEGLAAQGAQGGSYPGGGGWILGAPTLSEALAETDAILTAVAQLEARGQCACDAFLDPLSPRFYSDIWLRAARHNTRIFSCVFPDIMKDETMEQWTALDGQEPRRTDLLAGLVGKLTIWPKAFLCDQELTTRATEKEHYLPDRLTQ